ncbi:MAG: hypothetical protein ACYYKD_12325 [Rhodospirillales bacterium]
MRGGNYQPGQWFFTRLMAREIAEVIRHACVFAERFDSAETISFRAEWRGLSGRVPDDNIMPLIRWHGSQAAEDCRIATWNEPVVRLASQWADITAEILSKVTRGFNLHYSVSAQEINSWAKEWRSTRYINDW